MLTLESRQRLQRIPVLTPVAMHLPMIQRTALLNQPPAGHRGWWAYSRAIYGDLAEGQRVDFVCCGEVVVRAVVTGTMSTDDAQRLFGASGVNGNVFLWEEVKA